jgi:hypothetical protein
VFHGRERSIVNQRLYLDILSRECAKPFTHFALLPAPRASTDPTDAPAACELVPRGENPLDAMYEVCRSLHLEWLAPRTVRSFVVEGSMSHVHLGRGWDDLDVCGRSPRDARFPSKPKRPEYTFLLVFWQGLRAGAGSGGRWVQSLGHGLCRAETICDTSLVCDPNGQLLDADLEEPIIHRVDD